MTFTAGRRLFPADLVSEDPWTPYTMSWTASTTNPAIGNGTIVSRYFKLSAHTMALRIDITCGSTSTKGSGTYSFSTPLTTVGGALGEFWINDSGVAWRTGVALADASNTIQLYPNGAVAPLGSSTLTGTFTSSRIIIKLLAEV